MNLWGCAIFAVVVALQQWRWRRVVDQMHQRHHEAMSAYRKEAIGTLNTNRDMMGRQIDRLVEELRRLK